MIEAKVFLKKIESILKLLVFPNVYTFDLTNRIELYICHIDRGNMIRCHIDRRIPFKYNSHLHSLLRFSYNTEDQQFYINPWNQGFPVAGYLSGQHYYCLTKVINNPYWVNRMILGNYVSLEKGRRINLLNHSLKRIKRECPDYLDRLNLQIIELL